MMRQGISWYVAVVAVACLCLPALATVKINEIRIDEPGYDVNEYFELFGTPGEPLTGMTYLVIGDGSSDLSGVIEEAVSLDGYSINTNGYFLVAESGLTLGEPPDLVVADLWFENSDNVTHLLVTGFTGAENDDLDTDNNCTLDVTPWTSIVDRIAVVENDESPPVGTGCYYGTPKIGPDGTYAPSHVMRIPDGSTWEIGEYDPADSTDTPGSANTDVRVDSGATLALVGTNGIAVALTVMGGTSPTITVVAPLTTNGVLKDGGTTIDSVPHDLTGDLTYDPPDLTWTGITEVHFEVSEGGPAMDSAVQYICVQGDEVVISEVMHAPADDEDVFEYVEVYNYGTNGISLWGLGGDVMFEDPVANLLGKSIPAGSFKIIAPNTTGVNNEAFRCEWKLNESNIIRVDTDTWQNIWASGLVGLFEDTGGDPGLLDAVWIRNDEGGWPSFSFYSPDDTGHAVAVIDARLFLNDLTTMTNDAVYDIPPWDLLGIGGDYVAEAVQTGESGTNYGSPGWVPTRNEGYVPGDGCTAGKCCLPDGSCQVTFELECIDALCGVWTSDGDCTEPTGCTPVDTGECCTDAGGCYDYTQCQCDLINGTFDSNGDCSTNNCPVTVGVVINEFDYDNVSFDTKEFIELLGPPGQNLDDWSIELYNGNDGTVYDTIDLTGNSIPADRFFVIGTTLVPNYDIQFSAGSDNVQNGPDGIVLINGNLTPPDNIVEMVAYEGSFVATDGTASGLTLPDIGVDDQGRGGSIQRILDGETWTATPTKTPGQPNAGLDTTCKTIAEVKAQGLDIGVRLCDVVVSSTTDLVASGGYKNFHVQDDTRGIMVFGDNTLIDEILGGCGEGDRIDLYGTTDEYNSLFQLADGDVALELDENHGDVGVPAPTIVTLEDLQDLSTSAEGLESMLVTIECVAFTTNGLFAYGNYDITDDGIMFAAMRVGTSELELVNDPIPTGYVNITGIFSQYDYGAGNSGYQLMPRVDADITTCGAPPTGACCDDAGTNCIPTDYKTCAGYGGHTYQGNDVPCDPNPCVVQGSCCLPTGPCVDMGELDCLDEGGSWDGDLLCSAKTCPPPSAVVVINEIRIDQDGPDVSEYFELYGPGDTLLTGLTYLVIGDGIGVSGVIEAIVSLDGQRIPSDGYFVAAESTFDTNGLGAVVDMTLPGNDLNFENSDNVTHLLVTDFTGAMYDDLDTDDSGPPLDTEPWNHEHDRIALIEEENPPGGTEWHYGPPTLGPSGSNVPGHSYRDPQQGDAWTIGYFTAGLSDTAGLPNMVTGACCLPDGSCSDTGTDDDCWGLGGFWRGPGVDCAGDANSNGYDDACEEQVCEDCAGGDHWMYTCDGSLDMMPSKALVAIDTDLDCVADTTLTMYGPVFVIRDYPQDISSNFPGEGLADGLLDVIDTEMVYMHLTGGGATLVAGEGLGQGGNLNQTLGTNVEQVGDPSLVDSFFDVFFEIDLGGEDYAYNLLGEPVRVEAVIDCAPPEAEYVFTGCVELWDDPEFPSVEKGNLISVSHQTYLPVACVATDARSVKDHSGTDFKLAMGISGGIEARTGQITKLEIDLDSSASVSVDDTASVTCSTAWSGSATVTDVSTNGATVTVEFSPALPDQAYCVITLDCGAEVCVRMCEGDMNRSGATNTTDASAVKARFGATLADGNCEWDFNVSGAINTTDASAVKARFGKSTPDCP